MCACHGPLMSRGTSKEGRTERWSEARTAGEWDDDVRRKELWMQHSHSLMGGEICYRGVKVETSGHSPLEQRRR